MKKLHRFIASDDGAVTVDWVMLTAAIVTFVAVVHTVVPTALTTVSENTAAFLVNLSF